MASKLANEAQARGVALDPYIEQIVKAHSTAANPADDEQHWTLGEILAFRHEYNVNLGGLTLTDLIHEGHRF